MTLATATDVSGPRLRDAAARPSLRVWLVDAFCFTPWYTAELALALQQADVDVRLIANGFAREPGYFARLGLRPDPGPLRLSQFVPKSPAVCRRMLRTAEVLLSYQRLKRSMREESAHGPAVLHLQQTPMLQHGLRSDLALIDHAKTLGIPVVHTVHNLVPHDSGDRLHTVYRALYQRVDHLICHSPVAARDLVELFAVPEQSISVIPHGPLFAGKHPPSRSEVAAARQALGLPQGRPVVLWQGVLAEYKGLDVLQEAWTLCVRRCADRGLPLPLLLIAGSGPAAITAQVRAGAAAALGSSVRTDLDYIPTDRLPLYYTAADILVYPYRAITTSGALLTGLSYEKPIVASRLPAFQEFLSDGDNASLVEPGDAVALADALFVLAEECSGSPSTRTLPPAGMYARLAAGARRNRRRCTSWNEIGQRTAARYRELVACAPSRGRA